MRTLEHTRPRMPLYKISMKNTKTKRRAYFLHFVLTGCQNVFGAKSLTEVSIEFAQISLFNEPEALSKLDNLTLGYLKYKPNNCIEPWHTQP